MKPKISVIIPTLNEKKYLKKCLDSLKKQTMKNYEIIVVDSYSTDGTPQLARKYGKVVFEKRKGPGAARNTGAKRARGDILVFADADVRLERNFLKKIEKEFEKDIGGGICRLAIYDSKKTSYRIAYSLAVNLARFLNKIGIIITGGSCFAYRKKVFFRAGMFNPKFITNEDHDLARRVSRISRFMFFDGITAHTSCRRIKKKGLPTMVKLYIKSSMIYFLNHGYLRDYW